MSPLLSLHSPLQHVHVSTNKSEAVVCVCLQRLQHTLNARAPVTDVVWQQAGHLWKVGAEVFQGCNIRDESGSQTTVTIDCLSLTTALALPAALSADTDAGTVA